jgi:hypothetical protein
MYETSKGLHAHEDHEHPDEHGDEDRDREADVDTLRRRFRPGLLAADLGELRETLLQRRVGRDQRVDPDDEESIERRDAPEILLGDERTAPVSFCRALASCSGAPARMAPRSATSSRAFARLRVSAPHTK